MFMRERLNIADKVRQQTGPKQTPARRRRAKHPNLRTSKKADLSPKMALIAISNI
jgi:hypothetical protein